MKMTEETKAKIKASKENVKIHQITKKYRIVARESYLTMEKLKINDKTKESYWDAIGYHTELSWAIVSVSKHVVRDDIEDLMYVSEQLEEIKKLCNKMINGG